nr:uncharacterized protein LOC126054557 [Helicoverpa armigera]
MIYTPTVRPQVPGGPSDRAVSDGSQPGAGTRGVYNLRARSIPRQTTAANVLLDTDKLDVLTYNVRTLLKDERLVELENSLKEIRWDIVGLSELRREGEVTEERDDNIFFHIGTGSGLHGVGFLVAKKWKNNIIEFRGYSERIAVLKFRLTHTKTLTLVQTYAPTSAYSDDDVEDYYDLLNKACEDNRGTFNIVLGDFNAKIGVRQDRDDDKIIGPHGLGTRNERGSRLLQFAFGQMLSISNSFFTKKPQRRWTWMSPDDSSRPSAPIEYRCADTISPITGGEVDIALKSLKYNKSPGDDGISPSFSIEKGVKQGDPLSPNLFTCTLEEVFQKLSVPWTSKGIVIGNKRLTNLRFADDIVLFASTSAELQDMLQDLSRASREVGLQMNTSKTHTMTNSTKRRVEVDGQALHYVDEYIYLGQIVSFDNRQEKEIDRRIENAWKSYWSMKQHMKGDLPLSLKPKLVDMCILPVLTYGAQTWSLTECQKSKLKVCQRAMERSLLGIKRTDRIRNTVIRSRTGVADVGRKAATLKWNWAGHLEIQYGKRSNLKHLRSIKTVINGFFVRSSCEMEHAWLLGGCEKSPVRDSI